MADNFTKDPDAVLDYTVDWSDWLATSEVISTSAWSVGAGITQDSSVKTDTTAIVWLSGGTAGTDYQATNRITTDGGRTDDRTITIMVRER